MNQDQMTAYLEARHGKKEPKVLRYTPEEAATRRRLQQAASNWQKLEDASDYRRSLAKTDPLSPAEALSNRRYAEAQDRVASAQLKDSAGEKEYFVETYDPITKKGTSREMTRNQVDQRTKETPKVVVGGGQHAATVEAAQRAYSRQMEDKYGRQWERVLSGKRIIEKMKSAAAASRAAREGGAAEQAHGRVDYSSLNSVDTVRQMETGRSAAFQAGGNSPVDPAAAFSGDGIDPNLLAGVMLAYQEMMGEK